MAAAALTHHRSVPPLSHPTAPLLFFLASPAGSSLPGDPAGEAAGSPAPSTAPLSELLSELSSPAPLRPSLCGETGPCSAASSSMPPPPHQRKRRDALSVVPTLVGRRLPSLDTAPGCGSTMIKAILIFNNHGKPRLSKFYQRYSEDTQQQIIRETFHLVSKRDENVCNFLEGGLLIGGSDNKLIYRHYATLYFVFCVDSSESELGILDLIQVFVETLDKCFENVCELDLIFHVDKVHNILAEMVMGGMVLETNMNEIVTQIDAQNKLEKSEAGLAGAPARAVSAVKNMNLPEIPRNINIGDISIKVPNLPTFK
uniref:Adaptor related protein complex 3 subunit sigma 1 n=1 Tax=Coturnix japonica TaxID=93934 RepID=A0A8C2SZX4_COTJA